MKRIAAVILLVTFVFTIGCAGMSETEQRTVTGGLISAGAGGRASLLLQVETQELEPPSVLPAGHLPAISLVKRTKTSRKTSDFTAIPVGARKVPIC